MNILLTLIPIVGIGLFDALVLRFGADTRPGFDERMRHPF